jgi:hypothetical protein
VFFQHWRGIIGLEYQRTLKPNIARELDVNFAALDSARNISGGHGLVCARQLLDGESFCAHDFIYSPAWFPVATPPLVEPDSGS